MTGKRYVEVREQSRQVPGDAATGEMLSYTGVSITYYCCGQVASRTWLPAGSEPSVADDEALIKALRHAVIWNSAQLPPPWHPLHTREPSLRERP